MRFTIHSGLALMLIAAFPVAALAAGGPIENSAKPASATEADSGDSSSAPATRHQLTPTLRYGSKVKLEAERIVNRRLNLRDDEFSRVKPQFNLAFSYDPARRVTASVNIALEKRYLTDKPFGTESENAKLKLDEVHITWRELLGNMLLKIGRQRFKDEREWLYDEKLDAAKLTAQRGNFFTEFSASRMTLFQQDFLNKDDDDETNNFGISGYYVADKDTSSGGYVMVRDSMADITPEDLTFIGIFSMGEPVKHLSYWLNAAHVRGDFQSKYVRGWCLDAGVTYEMKRLSWRPSATVAAATAMQRMEPTKTSGELACRTIKANLADCTDSNIMANV